MRYNFISESADGIGFAIRLAQEDEDVRVWIRDKEAKSVGDGMVPKAGDLEDLVKDASKDDDIFIFDVSGNGVVADGLKEQGYHVLGGSVVADRLERDRSFGTEGMTGVGIKVPKSHEFTDFAKAKDFVKEHSDTRWVYKPSKQLGDLSPSHVSYDSEDLIEMMDNIDKEVDIEKPEFTLQEFVKGPTLSTEMWFQHGELIEPMTNHTFERKELMNDDIGPSGGCTGNIVWVCEGCPVCDEVKKLVPYFEDEEYHGMVDLNVIVAESGIYGLEFTPRFGYDSAPTLLWEVVNHDLGKFLSDAARGQLDELDLAEGYAAGVRVSVPPWPTEKYFALENVPIRGVKKSDSHVYFYNVKANEAGLCTAGAWGIICLFTDMADSIQAAFAQPYKQAEKIRVKDKQYRTDLVEAFDKDLKQLDALMNEVKAA